MADNFIANPGAGGNTFASDDIGGVQYPRSKVCWGADGAANDVSASAPLPVVFGLGDQVSAGNSSTAVLGASAVFTGTAVDTLGYSSISVGITPSHASATDGLSLQQSSDGTNWDNTDVYTVPAAAPTGKVYIINPTLRYFRVVYTNGATLQTSFRLQTILRVSPFTRGSVQRPQDARTNDNDYDETITYPGMFNGTTWDRLRGDITNGLDVDVTRLPALVASTATIGGVNLTPTTAAAQGLTPVSTTVVASGLVLKASAGNLYGLNVVSGASAGYVMVFNSTTVPADGTVTPIKVFVLAANASLTYNWETPIRFGTGCSVCFSTTGPYTKTASATAHISGECA